MQTCHGISVPSSKFFVTVWANTGGFEGGIITFTGPNFKKVSPVASGSAHHKSIAIPLTVVVISLAANH